MCHQLRDAETSAEKRCWLPFSCASRIPLSDTETEAAEYRSAVTDFWSCGASVVVTVLAERPGKCPSTPSRARVKPGNGVVGEEWPSVPLSVSVRLSRRGAGFLPGPREPVLVCEELRLVDKVQGDVFPSPSPSPSHSDWPSDQEEL